MRAHRGSGSVAAVALCLALAAAGPVAAVAAAPVAPHTHPAAAAAAAAADPSRLEVRHLTGSDIRLDDLAPGDTVDWAAEVTNASADGSPLAVRIDAERAMALTGDPEGGIQLSVRLCADGFASTAAPVRCRGPVEPLGSGPAATLGSVATSTPLAAGATVGVSVRVRFPVEADDRMESTAGLLRIGFALVDEGAGAGAGPGDAPGTAPGTAPAGSAPAADAPRDLLPVTGRDIAAAVVGALLALIGGAALVRAARRRRRGTATGTATGTAS
jgi:hypothetical protein